MLGDLTSDVGDAASSVSDRVSAAAGSVRDTASSLAETAMTAGRDALDGLSDATERSGRIVHDSSKGIGNAMHLLSDQPLVMGAIGMALGAAFGSALPSTSVEDRLMGKQADDLKEQAKTAAARGLEEVQAVAKSTLSEAERVANEQGLSADRLSAGAKDLGDKIAAVVDHATETLKTEASKAVRPDDPARR